MAHFTKKIGSALTGRGEKGMADMEKVIKGLEICYCPPAKCEDCPYHNLPDEQSCNDTLCLDALSLLKEQEPKQIVRKQGKREHSDGSIDYFGEWYCPHCGKLLNRGFDTPWIEFCYKCGQAVKWE